MARKSLLVCGILSSLLYVAMTVLVAMQWEAYSSASQTISELSAIGAPTRSLWAVPGAIYTLLVTAFGWGVWKSAGRSRALRIAGGLILAYGSLGVLWPFAPMHLRETLAAGGGTLSDTMHLVLASATVLLMLLAIGSRGRGIRNPVPRVLPRDSGDPHGVWRVDVPGCAPHRGESAHAVDRRLGAHQHRRVPAVGGGAGHDALACQGRSGRDRSPGSVGRLTASDDQSSVVSSARHARSSRSRVSPRVLEDPYPSPCC